MYRILTIGLDEARRVVEAASERASEMPEMPMTVAVVDRAGDPVYMVRQDGASPLTVRMAIHKARTAVILKDGYEGCPGHARRRRLFHR